MEKSPFPYSDDNKRYHTLAYATKRKFGKRVFKAVVDAGFTCPNLDGTKGVNGCTYCLNGGAEFAGRPSVPVKRQIEQEIARIREKWPQADVIAYFQAHTNTYAPLEKLRRSYESALEVNGVCGLSIATRVDALPPEVLDYLGGLSRQTYLTVELGLQTIHDETARRINRGHTWVEFMDGYQALRERQIRTCVHLIDGLPGETRQMMEETARQVGRLGPAGIKIHLLHVLEGTELARQYRAGEVALMEKQDYISVVCSQLELLPPRTVIERLTGDGSRERLLAPFWSLDKISVLGGIDKELKKRNTYQGKLHF